MARKRIKKRTHAGAKNPLTPATIKGHADPRAPKSMVIRIGAGEVGTSVSQLAADVRQVMEPGTATRLRERKANRLRDYVTMCGPLGVTHLLLFSRSEAGNTNLRLAIAPRGPTFHFRVEKYSLCNDVRRAQRRPRGGGHEYDTPPLLVMNNFTTQTSTAKSKVPRHLESLATTAFQSLFPPINPQTTPLKSIRRVLLLNRETIPGDENDSFILNFRHYAITTKAVSISRPLKRLNAAEKVLHSKKARKGGLPNLHKLQDISDFLIGGETGEGYMTDGGTSGSEIDTDAEVEVLETAPRKVLSTKARALAAAAAAEGAAPSASREGVDDEVASQATTTNAEHVERRAVRLVELGPRMRLRMTKVEDGLCSGKIMWHEHVEKSREEVRELERRWEEKRKEKEARKQQQKENVAKKKRKQEEARKAGKKASDEGPAGEDEDTEDNIHDEMEMDEYDSDLFDEVEEGAKVSDGEMEEDGWEDEDGGDEAAGG